MTIKIGFCLTVIFHFTLFFLQIYEIKFKRKFLIWKKIFNLKDNFEIQHLFQRVTSIKRNFTVLYSYWPSRFSQNMLLKRSFQSVCRISACPSVCLKAPLLGARFLPTFGGNYFKWINETFIGNLFLRGRLEALSTTKICFQQIGYRCTRQLAR